MSETRFQRFFRNRRIHLGRKRLPTDTQIAQAIERQSSEVATLAQHARDIGIDPCVIHAVVDFSVGDNWKIQELNWMIGRHAPRPAKHS